MAATFIPIANQARRQEMQRRAFHRNVLATVLLAASGVAAFAQTAAANFPSRVITMVVPYAAGGSSDTRARQIAAKMSTYLGQTVIVENRPGANGNIGTD